MGHQTPICKLSAPATCEYRVDGRLSHTILCGGNQLCDEVKKCPCRALAEIRELAATDSQQSQLAIALMNKLDAWDRGELPGSINMVDHVINEWRSATGKRG